MSEPPLIAMVERLKVNLHTNRSHEARFLCSVFQYCTFVEESGREWRRWCCAICRTRVLCITEDGAWGGLAGVASGCLSPPNFCCELNRELLNCTTAEFWLIGSPECLAPPILPTVDFSDSKTSGRRMGVRVTLTVIPEHSHLELFFTLMHLNTSRS